MAAKPDLVVRGGTVVDGTGGPRFEADLRTHYDAQVTWANHITPSTCNGVTTVLPGNGHP